MPAAIPPAGREDAARQALARALAADAEAQGEPEFPALAAADAAIQAAQRHRQVVGRQVEACEDLRSHAAQRGLFWRTVPELPRDVHDLAGLGEVADHVFAGQEGIAA